MTYLFWAFAIVWIALFIYLRALMRRTRALEDEVQRLTGGDQDALRAPGQAPSAAPVRSDEPSTGRVTP